MPLTPDILIPRVFHYLLDIGSEPGNQFAVLVIEPVLFCTHSLPPGYATPAMGDMPRWHAKCVFVIVIECCALTHGKVVYKPHPLPADVKKDHAADKHGMVFAYVSDNVYMKMQLHNPE